MQNITPSLSLILLLSIVINWFLNEERYTSKKYYITLQKEKYMANFRLILPSNRLSLHRYQVLQESWSVLQYFTPDHIVRLYSWSASRRRFPSSMRWSLTGPNAIAAIYTGGNPMKFSQEEDKLIDYWPWGRKWQEKWRVFQSPITKNNRDYWFLR
jgi:hypothetical protein